MISASTSASVSGGNSKSAKRSAAANSLLTRRRRISARNRDSMNSGLSKPLSSASFARLSDKFKMTSDIHDSFQRSLRLKPSEYVIIHAQGDRGFLLGHLPFR